MDIDNYILNFYNRRKKNSTLDVIKHFMKEFGNPEKNLKFIHIAGTNGKGSLAEMMTKVLINAGYKVGKFISPHLVKFNERISINNQDISDEEIEKLVNIIDPKIKEYDIKHENKVTWFELETIMALIYFHENKCDFVVLETGIGGLHDCTNIVNPLISIITSIGYDHMNILGNTLPEIAEQKAGIIKKNSETVFFKQDSNINRIIENKCKNENNILHMVEKDEISNYSYNEKYQKFDYKQYKNVQVGLKGKTQVYNATICIESIEILKNKGFMITENDVKNGLKEVIHKGRFEVISENPVVVYDGGHNESAIKNLKDNINMYYKDLKKVYIISILRTKDYSSILKELLKDENGIFIFTSGNYDMYATKEELLEEAKKYTSNKHLYAIDLNEALEIAVNKYKKCAIFVIGSFYIYGDVINKLEEMKND